MINPLRIRAADEKEAYHIAELINIASSNLEINDWEAELTPDMKERGMSPLDVGASHVLDPNHNFHYSNTKLAVQADKVVGLLLSYPIKQKSDKDRANLSAENQIYHDLKQRAVGYFYIDSLAIYPDFQGKGIGSQLLDHAMSMAREQEFQNICLLAYEENFGAVRLYKRKGFRITHKEAIPDTPYMPFEGHVLLLEKLCI